MYTQESRLKLRISNYEIKTEDGALHILYIYTGNMY